MVETLLTGVPLDKIGAAALVVIAVLLLYFGKLVTGASVDRMERQYEARIEELKTERDDWKAAHGTSERTRELQAVQSRELVEVGRTLDHLIRSLRSSSGIDSATIRPPDADQ